MSAHHAIAEGHVLVGAGLGGQTEHPLTEHVALNLVGARGDAERRGAEELLLPGAVVRRILADEHLTGPARELVQTRLDLLLKTHIEKLLAPLFSLTAADDVTGMARGVAFQLIEALGVLERQKVSEEVKGLEAVREASAILRDSRLPEIEYAGFVEGDDIGKGTVDVVVTEGFAGNIALKTAEGTARQLGQYLKSAMTRTLLSKLGYLLARGAFRTLSEKMDPRKSNGGVFLGLNGIVIKSHGATDAEGFAAAIELGYDVVRDELLTKITAALARPRREPQAALSGAAS